METNRSLSLALNAVKIGFAVIGVLLVLLAVMYGDPAADETVTEIMKDEQVDRGQAIMLSNEKLDSRVGGVMMLTYLGMGICALAAIIFGIVFLVTNIKNSKGFLIGLAAFVLILLVGYMMGGDEVLSSYGSKDTVVTPGDSKFAEGAIISIYILAIIAILAMVYTEVKSIIK